MEARAEALVDQHWVHIESVAKVLLKQGAITSDIRTFFDHQRQSSRGIGHDPHRQ
jgi:hypothetical protein